MFRRHSKTSTKIMSKVIGNRIRPNFKAKHFATARARSIESLFRSTSAVVQDAFSVAGRRD